MFGYRGVEHLSGLVALEQLNLSENVAVQDRGLEGLSRLTCLASLDLSYTGERLYDPRLSFSFNYPSIHLDRKRGRNKAKSGSTLASQYLATH